MRSARPMRGFSTVGVLCLVILLVAAVLLFAFPIKAHKETEAARQLAIQLEQAQATSLTTALSNQPKPPIQRSASALPEKVLPVRPIGFGLSFAMVPAPDGAGADVAHLSCHGEPREVGRPHEGSCNPYQGDTSCRVALPMLCIQPGSTSAPVGVTANFYQGWTGGVLAATQPVMGALLGSATSASSRCVAQLGAGWRMAEFHDGGGGWGLQGRRGSGFGAWTRYWVFINEQPGHCWNSQI